MKDTKMLWREFDSGKKQLVGIVDRSTEIPTPTKDQIELFGVKRYYVTDVFCMEQEKNK